MLCGVGLQYNGWVIVSAWVALSPTHTRDRQCIAAFGDGGIHKLEFYVNPNLQYDHPLILVSRIDTGDWLVGQVRSAVCRLVVRGWPFHLQSAVPR